MYPENFSLSPVRVTVAAIGITAAWLFAPEIAQAAVAFGEIGQNVAENAKGVAKGITMGGFATGIGMGVWGGVDMYNASLASSLSDIIYNIFEYKDIILKICLIGFIWTYGHTPLIGVKLGVDITPNGGLPLCL